MSTKILSASELYDSVGPAYERAFANHTTHAESLTWLCSQLSSSSSSSSPCKILDIGCGTGNPTISTLTTAGHQVHGIDISHAMLESARLNVPHGTFQQISVDDFTCPPSTYDAITVYFSFLTVDSQNLIRERIRRIHGWLKPGGLFVFATVPMDLDHAPGRWWGRDFVASSMPTTKFLELFEKEIGFEVLEYKEDRFTPRAAEVGICRPEDVDEERHLWIYARKN